MRILASLALVCICSPSFAAPSAPPIPDTPAGHTLKAWLDAFNSGDRARIEQFVATYHPDLPAAQLAQFRRETGGFELLGVDKSERLHIEFHVKEQASPTEAVGTLEVKEGDPATIAVFDLKAIPPGMKAADMHIKVDAATRARVLDGIATRLTEEYVYPDVAKKMIAAMRAHQKKGDYDAITDGMTLASVLTDHLRAVSHDKHLNVACVPRVLPKPDFPEDPPPDPQMRAHMERRNCGFEKAELLERNIGYLKFDFFGDPSVCGATATAAMGFVANADALIFDLRENHGGDPAMVAYVASYLFDTRTHLNDLFRRSTNKTTEYWTKPELPGKKLGKTPVYVLTSSGTFSGGEEFVYDLKNLKRATIVGETTGGGAHPTGPHRVDDHFLIAVPGGRPINPVTKTDWEGTGVVPDVKVAADKALETAVARATAELTKSTPRAR